MAETATKAANYSEELTAKVIADYQEGIDLDAIAEKVGKSNEAVKVSLRRSRAVLSNNVPELAIVLDNVAQSA